MVLMHSGHTDTGNDSDIIDRYRNSGDRDYIAVLFNRYSKFVLAVCMKYLKDQEEAEEASLEIFESLVTKLLRQSVSHFKTWLYSVTKNHCLQILRKNKTRLKHEDNFAEERDDIMESEAGVHLNNTEEFEWQLEQVEKALEELKPEQKTCVHMFYLQEMSYAEIAANTGYPLKKVKSYIQNGKRKLKLMMSNKDD